MKKYIVKAEYIDLWGNDSAWSENPVVTDEDIKNAAAGWGMNVYELLNQVDEIEQDEAAEAAADIISAGNYAAAVALMDDELREEIHADGNANTKADFLAEYIRRHLDKYGEPFTV